MMKHWLASFGGFTLDGGRTPNKNSLPAWALGMDLAADYVNNLDYYPVRGLFPPGTDTHAASIYARNAAGVYLPFAANVPVRTDLGMQTVPTRTNLFTYSRDQSNAAWVKYSMSVMSNATLSPFGAVDADAYIEDGTTSQHVQGRQLSGLTANQNHTYSVIIKKGLRKYAYLYIWNSGFTSNVVAEFNLLTGTVDYTAATGSGVFSNAGITALGDGWYQCWVSGKCDAVETAPYAFLNPANDSQSDNYAGSNGSTSIYVAQSQFEANTTFPTPPIVTTTTAVTVDGNQQVVDLTGKLASGVAGLFQLNIFGANTAERFFEFNNGASSANSILFARSGGNIVIETGAFDASLTLAAYASGLYTMAFAFGNNYAMARIVGQAAPTPDTSVAIPSGMSKLGLGGLGYSSGNNTHIQSKKLALKFGAVDQTVFDAVYAKAVLAAAA